MIIIAARYLDGTIYFERFAPQPGFAPMITQSLPDAMRYCSPEMAEHVRGKLAQALPQYGWRVIDLEEDARHNTAIAMERIWMALLDGRGAQKEEVR